MAYLATHEASWLFALGLIVPALAAFIDYEAREIKIKLVYADAVAGIARATLAYLHQKFAEEIRGPLLELNSEDASHREGLRTRFPPDHSITFSVFLGDIRGFKAHAYLFTYPEGQGEDREAHRKVLKALDAVVFVVDCDPSRVQLNLDALSRLRSDLRAMGQDPATVLFILQLDNPLHPQALQAQEMRRRLGLENASAVAGDVSTGDGVYDTLSVALKHSLANVRGSPISPVIADAAPPSNTGASTFHHMGHEEHTHEPPPLQQNPRLRRLLWEYAQEQGAPQEQALLAAIFEEGTHLYMLASYPPADPRLTARTVEHPEAGIRVCAFTDIEAWGRDRLPEEVLGSLPAPMFFEMARQLDKGIILNPFGPDPVEFDKLRVAELCRRYPSGL